MIARLSASPAAFRTLGFLMISVSEGDEAVEADPAGGEVVEPADDAPERVVTGIESQRPGEMAEPPTPVGMGVGQQGDADRDQQDGAQGPLARDPGQHPIPAAAHAGGGGARPSAAGRRSGHVPTSGIASLSSVSFTTARSVSPAGSPRTVQQPRQVDCHRCAVSGPRTAPAALPVHAVIHWAGTGGRASGGVPARVSTIGRRLR